MSASEPLVESEDERVNSFRMEPATSLGDASLGTRSSSGGLLGCCTRFSIEGDSAWNNLKRNVWCNIKGTCEWFYNKITEPSVVAPSVTGTQRRPYDIVDVYKTIEDPHIFNEEMKSELQKKKILIRIVTYLLMEQSWLLLILLGTFCAITAILLDWSVQSLSSVRESMEEQIELVCPPGKWGCSFARFLAWASFNMFFCLTSGFVVRFVSPQAAGSGLPEMKSILSGVVLSRYLSYRTYLAKTIGLICALAGGLSIGKEGPFVHISAIIAAQLSKFTLFNRIRKNEALRFQMLSAGCAVGVATVFGAPVGGVLFAIEVTTTYFLMQNLWRSFFCAVAGAVIVKIGGQTGLVAMFATDLPADPYHYWELVVFVLIGVSFGYLGAMFVKFVLKLVHLRRDYRILSETRYMQLVVVSIITSCIMYPFWQLGERGGTTGVINAMFSTRIESWTHPSAFLTLPLYFVIKFIMTAVSLGLPVPCGLYTPVFAMGAAGGRLVGELLTMLFAEGYIQPAGYAVVGAAAMSAGVTRTLSTAVIVFELTGQMSLLIPVLVATIIGTAVGNMFSTGVYETLLEQKRLPYMPPFGNLRMPSNIATAGDLMRNDVVFLSANGTYNQVAYLLDNFPFASFPVVDSPDSMVLRAEISRTALVRMLEEKDRSFANTVEAQILRDMGKSINRLDTVARLKNRYRVSHNYSSSTIRHYSPIVARAGRVSLGFAEDEEDETDDEEDIEEDVDVPVAEYADMEMTLSQRRTFFFNDGISDTLQMLPSSELDLSPFQVPEPTHFYRIHFMFAMLGLNHAFITRNGKLVGVITKKDFLEKTRTQILWNR